MFVDSKIQNWNSFPAIFDSRNSEKVVCTRLCVSFDLRSCGVFKEREIKAVINNNQSKKFFNLVLSVFDRNVNNTFRSRVFLAKIFTKFDLRKTEIKFFSK